MHSWNRNYVNNKIGMKSHLNLLESPLSLEQFQITGMENWKPICVTFSDKKSNGSDVCTTDQCARGVSVYFRLASTSKHDSCLRWCVYEVLPMVLFLQISTELDAKIREGVDFSLIFCLIVANYVYLACWNSWVRSSLNRQKSEFAYWQLWLQHQSELK